MNADQYLNHWIKNKVWTHLVWPKHQARFIEIAKLLVGESAIDVGCAFGHSTYHLNRFFRTYWAGLDFSERAIAKARQLFPQFEFFYSKDYDLKKALEGRKFDSVVCSEVLEHVEDDEALIKGLLSIAKKRVVLTTPDRRVSDPGHLRIYTSKTLSNLLEGKNFEIIQKAPFFYIVIEKKRARKKKDEE